MNKKIDLQIINETIEDLKNNDKSCILVGGESINGVFTIPESMPSEKLEKFIKYLYDNDLLDKNYLENSKLFKNKAIEDLTLEESITRLTFFIRGDRFSSGLLKSKVDDGTILKLVELIKKRIND